MKLRSSYYMFDCCVDICVYVKELMEYLLKDEGDNTTINVDYKYKGTFNGDASITIIVNEIYGFIIESKDYFDYCGVFIIETTFLNEKIDKIVRQMLGIDY